MAVGTPSRSKSTLRSGELELDARDIVMLGQDFAHPFAVATSQSENNLLVISQRHLKFPLVAGWIIARVFGDGTGTGKLGSCVQRAVGFGMLQSRLTSSP
jgi:hypothetical protein